MQTVPPYVRLVNEIAAQFPHKPPAEAAVTIANHLRTVWDPRMKKALIEYWEAGGDELVPAAALAAKELRLRVKL
jgi:formate dehydrogenase subunit delta